MSHKAYPGSGRKAYPGASTTICQRGALRFGNSDRRWLGCYAEPKQGGLVRPVATLCFMRWPLYTLCDNASRQWPKIQGCSQETILPVVNHKFASQRL